MGAHNDVGGWIFKTLGDGDFGEPLLVGAQIARREMVGHRSPPGLLENNQARHPLVTQLVRLVQKLSTFSFVL